MNYVEHLSVLGIDADPIPCNKGNGPPTSRTEGAVGCFYMDLSSSTKDIYKCVGARNGVYTWMLLDNRLESSIDKLFENWQQANYEHNLALDLMNSIMQEVDGIGEMLSGYVTPEMFGAVGGGADDYEALQACIDYARTNKKTVTFLQDYTTSESIIVEGDGTYNPKGMYINGNNKHLIVSRNIPALIVRGNGNRIENLTITFTRDLYDLVADRQLYTSSLVQLQSQITNEISVCDRNTFINVTCRCNMEWRSDSYYTSVGFEFVLEGDSSTYCHAYENNFISCRCRNLGTAIKVTENEYSSGCNGNILDIGGWFIEHYLDGRTGGCTFSGIIQTHKLQYDDSGNILNKYLIQNIGEYNQFNNNIFDYNYSKTGLNWPLVCDDSGAFNYFAQPITDTGVLNRSVKNIYNVVSNSCGSLIMPLSPFMSGGYAPRMTYMPFRNSFNSVDSATLTIENMTLSNGYYTASDKYPEVVDGIPTNVAAVFHDDSDGRTLGFFKCTGTGDGVINIEFVPKGIIDAMYIYLSDWDISPKHIQLILEYADGTVVTEDMVQTIGHGGSYAHYLAYAAKREEQAAKATIRIATSSTQNIYISQICGYMHTRIDGII